MHVAGFKYQEIAEKGITFGYGKKSYIFCPSTIANHSQSTTDKSIG